MCSKAGFSGEYIRTGEGHRLDCRARELADLREVVALIGFVLENGWNVVEEPRPLVETLLVRPVPAGHDGVRTRLFVPGANANDPTQPGGVTLEGTRPLAASREAILDSVEMPVETDAVGLPTAVVDVPNEAKEVRKRTRWAYFGFGLGIVVGFVVTAVHVVIVGYHILPALLVWNLIWAPYLGLILGTKLGRKRRAGPWKWRRPQLRTQTLMVVVAYVALLFGMGVSTQRLGNSARLYYQKYVTADSMAHLFREQGKKSEAEASQKRDAVDQLRAGKNPDSLHPIQKDFLRSLELDPKVTPEYRKYRRGLITDGEERTGTMQERNAVVYRGLVEYNEQLAAKYNRARWRPWLPVEPDPPMPPTQ
jgi:hypothetical protein